ncbi:MAG: AMIN domain-containing protein [Desulfovibrionaceae bacterium]|nr:AMIN domain-containing protein [Desulfovibrionaceae bacterium]
MSSILRYLGCAVALTVVAVATVFVLQEKPISASPAAHHESSGKIDSRSLPYVHGKISPGRQAQKARPETQRAAAAPDPSGAAIPVTYGEMQRRVQQKLEAMESRAESSPSRQEKEGDAQAEQDVSRTSGAKEAADSASAAPSPRADEAKANAPVLSVHPFSFGETASGAPAANPVDSLQIAGGAAQPVLSPATYAAASEPERKLPKGDTVRDRETDAKKPDTSSAAKTLPPVVEPTRDKPLPPSSAAAAQPQKASAFVPKREEPRPQSFDRVVTSAQFVMDGSLIKLVLQGNAPMVGHCFQLHDPERVVLDLSGTWRIQIPRVPSNRLIQSVRLGRHENKTRLVFDLKNPGRSALVPVNRNALELHVR